LVQQARYIEDHLSQSLRMSALCSNDPICAHHIPGKSMEERWLHGAACHGCALVAETSCEMRNDYLDRALVIPVLGLSDAAFFQAQPPGYRKVATFYVMSAKREETRARRLATLIRDSASGRRIGLLERPRK